MKFHPAHSRFQAAVIALLIALPVGAQTLKTPAEESGWGRYSQSEDVARFLQAVSQASKSAKLQTIGKSMEGKSRDGKAVAPADLYLCVITEEGVSEPKALNRGKLTFMLVASQHGNEQSGKEAALQLIRDLSVGELKPMLKKMNFLIIPQANPYGNFVDQRQNEQGLDLNRDHVKLEAPETQAAQKVFRAWMPEVTMDIHEKGDDYYRVSTGCVSNINIDPRLESYSRSKVFPALDKIVAADGFTWHEYLVSEAMGSNRAAGAPDQTAQNQPRQTLMRPSTTDLNDGRNGPGIFNTLSFIQECSSQHNLPTLQERTKWQYSGIHALMQIVADDSRQVMSMVRSSRADLLRRAAKPATENVVHLRMENVRDPKEPQLTIKAFDGRGRGAANTGQTPALVTQVVSNWFPKVESRLAVPRPIGYLIPLEHQDVVKTLLDQGIIVGTFVKDTAIEGESYQIRDVVPATEDYVAPSKIDVDIRPGKVQVRKGDFFVSAEQPAANLISCLLEPQSEYGLIRYQAYKLVPAKGASFPVIRVINRKPNVAPFGPATSAR